MDKIVSVAGCMLTKAIDNINRNKMLAPMFVGYKKGCKEIKKSLIALSLEQSIPKIISMYEKNEQSVEYASIVFPAELDSNGQRESIIMLMAQEYKSSDYIVVSLPYKIKDGIVKVKEYELIDYSPFLLDKLKNLEKSFIDGLLSYGDAKEIWSK